MMVLQVALELSWVSRQPSGEREPQGAINQQLMSGRILDCRGGECPAALGSGRSRLSRVCAFTLMELMIVTVILSVVITVIGACFSAGLRVWESARNFSRVESDLLIGFGMLERDFRNTFKFHGIEFRGGSAEVSFPAELVTASLTEPLVGTVPQGRVSGTIKYAYDPATRTLTRRTWPWGAPEPDPAKAERLIQDVQNVKFLFLENPEAGKTLVWKDLWSSGTNFPAGLQVTLWVGTGGEGRRVHRTLLSPTAKAAKKNTSKLSHHKSEEFRAWQRNGLAQGDRT